MNQRKIGALLSYVSLGLNSIIGIIYIPLLLHFLTKEQYGLYQLVGAMIVYLGTMDFGLANTTTRYYSRFLALKDTAQQQNLLATVSILYGTISVLIVGVGIGLFYFLFPFYTGTLSPQELLQAKYLFFILLFNISFSVPMNIFSAVINSHERFVFARLLMIGNIVFRPFFSLALLALFPNTITLALCHTFCSALFFTVQIIYCFKKLHVRFKLTKWDPSFVKQILSFSFFIFLIALMDIVYVQTGQLVLGAVVGTAAVAVYSIGIQFLMIYRQMSGGIFSVFLPYFSAAAAKTDDMTEINATFVRISRLEFLILSLILCGFILYGKTFILTWVGPGFLAAYGYAVVLMLGYLWISSQNTASLIVQAKNKHAPYALIYAGTGILSIILSILFARAWGGMGCVAGTVLSLLIGQGLITNIYFAKIGIDVKGYFANTLFLAVGAGISLLVGWGLTALFPPSNWVRMCLQIPIFTLLFVGIHWLFFLNPYEKDLLFFIPQRKLTAWWRNR